MQRRDLLGAALAWPGLALIGKGAKIDRGRLSTITDESAKTPMEGIEFARKFSLKWLEVRNVPGARKHYEELTEAELRQAAKEFADGGVKVSFFNSGQCKYTLPGTEIPRSRPETPEQKAAREARDQRAFDNRIESLRKTIRASQILGCDKIRIFAFLRVAEPSTVMPRIYDVVGEMTKVAEKEGVKLLIENEVACNVARCDELAAMIKAIPSKALGINWDPLNGHHKNEEVMPHGYSLLPKKKIWNVQVKGKSILPEFTKDYLDWAAIYSALERDGYAGQIGLECHIFGPELIERSHQCMQEMIRIAENRQS
jgi:sugar phosphate isomerase/epimerase